MCDNADTCQFEFDSASDHQRTQEMYDKVVSKEPFMLTKYYLDEYNKAQEMCDKADNAFLPTLKFVHGQFVANKMLEKVEDIVFSYGDHGDNYSLC